MLKSQYAILVAITAGLLGSACSFSPNVPNGKLMCADENQCPSGYTCENVPGAQPPFKVCCKDQGCGALVPVAPAPGSDTGSDLAAMPGAPEGGPETGALLDGPPVESGSESRGDVEDAPAPSDSDDDAPEDDAPADSWEGLDLPGPDLRVPDAAGSCGLDQDCPPTAPMCFHNLCAACTGNSDCTGNAAGGLCDTTTGRCAACLGDGDCKDQSKPLCANGKCTACTYATVPNGCCADADCTSGGTGTIGKCGTAHTCSYACDTTTYKACNAACIRTTDCCTDNECTSGGTGTVGKCGMSHACSYACNTPTYKDCNGACISAASCCVDKDCKAGNVCNASNACVPMPGCGSSTPTLGCACSQSGSIKCNGAHQKVRLVCSPSTSEQTGLVWQLLDTCSSTAPGFNCDNRDATCQPVLPGCSNQAPGFAYCDASAGSGYRDVRKVCGPDLVTDSSTQTCPGLCAAGTCQSPICGDHKVQTNEECDDGNTVPLDGCEPGSCVKSGVVKVAPGDGHTCALCRGGYVRCWGQNDHGELGLGHTTFQGNKNPYQVADAAGNSGGYVNLGGVAATDVVSGFGFSCALLTGGSVRCWGMNDLGQLGLGNTTALPSQIGAAISFGSGVTAKAVSASLGYACAILSNNTIRCWGDNSAGHLGLGNTASVLSGTVALPTTPAPTAISIGTDNACVLLSGGQVHCWGDNYFGEFGLGNSATLFDSTATLPSAYGNASLATTAASISVGGAYNCARLTNGSAECWGANDSGQLGIGNTVNIGDTQVPGTSGIVQIGSVSVSSIVASINHSCALLANQGGLKCWGNNSKGQLGYGDTTRRGDTGAKIPLNIPLVSFPVGVTVTGVFLGNAYTCALMVDNSNTSYVRCWGANERGQLGLAKVSASVGSIPSEPPAQIPAVLVFPP